MVGRVEPTLGLSLAQACHIVGAANEDMLERFVERNEEHQIVRVTKKAFAMVTNGELGQAIEALCDNLHFVRVASASTMLACAFPNDVPILDAQRWLSYRWFWHGEHRPEPLHGVTDHRHYAAYARDIEAFVASPDNPSLTPLEVSDWLDGCEPTWLAIFQQENEVAA